MILISRSVVPKELIDNKPSLVQRSQAIISTKDDLFYLRKHVTRPGLIDKGFLQSWYGCYYHMLLLHEIFLKYNFSKPNSSKWQWDTVKVIWPWWRHQMEIFSALLAFCEGNSPVLREFPSQRPVTRGFDVFLSAPEQRVVQTIETPVIWDAIALITTSL